MTPTLPIVQRTGSHLVAMLIPLLAITAACAGPENTVDPLAELRARPSLEQAVDRYQQMQRRIQTEITEIVGPRNWSDRADHTEGSCGEPFDKIYDGVTWGLPRYGFDGGFTPEQWTRVARAINSVLTEYGFSTGGLVNEDRNGSRTISAIEQATGATFEFGSARNTAMLITTGCHLPTAKKPG